MLGEESFQPRQVPAVSIYDGEGVVEMRMIVDYRIVQKRGDQVGEPLQIVEIHWDDTGPKSRGRLERPDWLSLLSLRIVSSDIFRANACVDVGCIRG